MRLLRIFTSNEFKWCEELSVCRCVWSDQTMEENGVIWVSPLVLDSTQTTHTRTRTHFGLSTWAVHRENIKASFDSLGVCVMFNSSQVCNVWTENAGNSGCARWCVTHTCSVGQKLSGLVSSLAAGRLLCVGRFLRNFVVFSCFVIGLTALLSALPQLQMTPGIIQAFM